MTIEYKLMKNILLMIAFTLAAGTTATAQKYIPDWNKVRDLQLSYIDSDYNNRKVTRSLIVDRDLSATDSARLAHYLIGFGWLPGKGDFVKNRRVYMDSALSIARYDADLYFQKAYPLLMADKFEVGMPLMDSAVKYDRDGYILNYRGYIKCIFQKHYREAITDLTLAIQESGQGHIEDHTCDFYLGLCYLQLNKFDSCEYLFTKAIDQQQKDYGYKVVHYLNWFYLGMAKFEQDDYAGAMACLDSSLARYPQFSDAEFYKAWCLSELHEDKRAVETITQANNDFKAGYTLNEDNARLEPYPYQTNKYHLEESLDILQKKLTKQTSSPK